MAKQLTFNFRSAWLKYQLMKGAWFVHEPAIKSQIPLVNDFINNNLELAEEYEEAESSLPYTIKLRSNSNPAISKNISVIPIEGSLMKSDYCGAPGMQTIANRIKLADESPQVDGIILKVDSPGGTVDGTQELGDVVKNVSKPIVSFADGLMASAAYWVGSSADMVIAKDNTTEVGSIGVVMSFVDYDEYYAKEGIKTHTVFADQSSEKWKEIEDASKGDYSTLKEWTLNPLAKEFQDTVLSNRPDVKDKALHGRVFLAKDAKKMGLIDKIGNFEIAIKELNKLINKNVMSEKNKEVEMTIPEDEKGFFEKLVSLVKPEVKDISEDTKAEYEKNLSDSAHELSELKSKLEELDIENKSLKSKVDEKDNEISGNASAIESHVSEIDDLKGENEELKTKLTKNVASTEKIEVEDDKLEIGKLSEEEAAWVKEATVFKESF